jgi:DNA-directed RNA polymerase specialized sigma24 family protein
MNDWELTAESFDLFLSWLDPDRDLAGKQYERIRRRLIIMLDGRGCVRSEDVADETINRFIRRLPAIRDTYTGDPVPYLCAIARRVHSEHIAKQFQPLPDNLSTLPLADDTSDEQEEQRSNCLEKCLEKLEPASRELVIGYYQKDKQAKIDFRKRLAGEMGIAVNALRIRVHRVRVSLHECINDCLELGLPHEMK